MLCLQRPRESDEPYRIIQINGRNHLTCADATTLEDAERIYDLFREDNNTRILLLLWRDKNRVVKEYIKS